MQVGKGNFLDKVHTFLKLFTSGTYYATEPGASCLQSPVNMIGKMDGPVDEDCLFLNVWVPQPKDKVREVMVCYNIIYLRYSFSAVIII